MPGALPLSGPSEFELTFIDPFHSIFNMQQDFQTPNYPVVQFLVAQGKNLSIALSALLFLGALGLGLFTGTLWVIPAGLVLAGVVLGLLLSYIEVLRIIADTLIPKY